MIRINLLPHREQKRKARAARFAVVAFVAALTGVAIVGAGYLMLSAEIAMQDSRNAFLQEENSKLDKQIAEIETLKKERQLLLDRKKVVERLQTNRAEAVNILDQLIRQTPEGIYFKDLKQSGELITLSGYAQSGARVSTLMRSLSDSPEFQLPFPVEIRGAQLSGQRVSEFTLTIKVVREALEDSKDKKAGKKGPPQGDQK
ncbi:PilN domain-containing protein [Burkholderiaceae bacterium DAT-1]|nr:PilN domain-containing protein [Burkholderiaceae bacterium DAT-1]